MKPREWCAVQSKEREHGESPQIEPHKGAASRLRPPQLNREAGAKQQRERAVRVPLRPDARSAERSGVVQPAGLGRALVEVEHEYFQQREAAEDVEGGDPFVRDHCLPTGSGFEASEVCSTAWVDPTNSPTPCPRRVAAGLGAVRRNCCDTKPQYQHHPISSRSRLSDDGLPGAGPIRRSYRFEYALARASVLRGPPNARKDQGAVVFLGDSITQMWGEGLQAAFPGVKVANRGISGDTSRGVLIRLQEDVLALNPTAGSC